MGFFSKIFGDPNEKTISELSLLVEKINGLEEMFSNLSNEDLRSKTFEYQGVFKAIEASQEENKDEMIKSALEEILPEAFAIVREAAKRVLGQRHYDVQLIGGIVLHRGQIAEMRTGEGKTLVATLAVYLNALTGRGVHVITVNDYLARRDAEWMGMIYSFLGLSVGCITHEAAHLLGNANNFQFSNSNEEISKSQTGDIMRQVSRKEAYQADITYGTNNEYGFDYLRDNMSPDLAKMVQRELNFAIVDEVDSILIDEARTPLIISSAAEESTDKYYTFSKLVEHLAENEDYNIDEKMRASTLTESGIAKLEKMMGVKNIYAEGGMRDVHHIEQALKAMTLFKRDRDYVVKEGEVIIVDEFTGRLMHGRRYSEGLHQAIEAKEGVKIQRESQTMATVTFQNYFRMYRKLAGMTGTAVTEAEEFYKIYNLDTIIIPTNRPMSRLDLNDLIYSSEMGKFKAVIQEIKRLHQTGQPVLVGTISIEKNELLGEMLEREGVQPQILNAKHHEKEAQIIADAGKVGAVTIATNMAGRGVDIMLGGREPAKDSPEHEAWAEERARVLACGGLHIIGTERHESRRIDNQLRGRAGRQGDPGSSQFYVSMEDDLMRIFGGDRMKNIMATLRVPEDLPIENNIISKSIESAQKKVEGNNFDTRKHLLEYDDVLNKHREGIYKKRREILELSERLESPMEDRFDNESSAGENTENQDKKTLSKIILEMVEDEIEQVVSFHTAAESMREWNIAEINQVMSTIFPVNEQVKADIADLTGDSGKLDKVMARTAMIEKFSALADDYYRQIKDKISQVGLDWQQVEKSVLLRSIDLLWVEHLEAIDYMRRGIGLRGYGQRDPLVEYKREAYRLYSELNNLIQKEVAYSIFKIAEAGQFFSPSLLDRQQVLSAPAKEMDKQSGSFSAFKQEPSSNQPKTVDLVKEKAKDKEGNKIGRNDSCPCGSGKKYKKCCGK